MRGSITANQTSLLCGFLGGKNITFKEKDRVTVVAGSSNYKGKHSGRSGTVVYVYENNSSGNIAVVLDDMWNSGSSKGWFYFKESDLRRSNASTVYKVAVDISKESQNEFDWVSAFEKLDQFEGDITIFENEGAENNMKSEKILDLWKSNTLQSIANEFVAEKAKILDADPVCTEVRRHIDEIDKMLGNWDLRHNKLGGKTDYESFVCDATKGMIGDAKGKMENEKRALNELGQEIAAMLSACDTYEQEMDVLRTYNVVEEDGRLNKFFSL